MNDLISAFEAAGLGLAVEVGIELVPAGVPRLGPACRPASRPGRIHELLVFELAALGLVARQGRFTTFVGAEGGRIVAGRRQPDASRRSRPARSRPPSGRPAGRGRSGLADAERVQTELAEATKATVTKAATMRRRDADQHATCPLGRRVGDAAFFAHRIRPFRMKQPGQASSPSAEAGEEDDEVGDRGLPREVAQAAASAVITSRMADRARSWPSSIAHIEGDHVADQCRPSTSFGACSLAARPKPARGQSPAPPAAYRASSRTPA